MEQCIANVSAAIDDAALLADGIAGEPSKNRWGSMAEHDAEQAVGKWFLRFTPDHCKKRLAATGTWGTQAEQIKMMIIASL